MIPAMDIVVSSLGVLYVGSMTNVRHKDPMTILKNGYIVTAVSPLLQCVPAPRRCHLRSFVLRPQTPTHQAAAAVGFFLICRTLLAPPSAPQAWLHFAGCGVCGMLTAYVFIGSTQYYTDYAYHPVRSIAEVKRRQQLAQFWLPHTLTLTLSPGQHDRPRH